MSNTTAIFLMKIRKLIGLRLLKTFLALWLVLTPGEGFAQALSSAPLDHSDARLFQATSSDGAWTAGLEIALGTGWKTYWRMPGDSGVPPQFDWSKSTNLKSVSIGWPAPQRYHDAAGETIGYQNHIVFPLRIEPLDAAKPVKLALLLFYAVCKDICIPAQSRLDLEFSTAPNESTADKLLLDSFAARIPSGQGSSLIPSVKLLRVKELQGQRQLEVTLTGTLPVQTTDIFVEGYPKAYFRHPTSATAGPKTSIFHLTIDGLTDLSELSGKTLTLTVVSGPASLVQTLAVE
jgi:DsbC/DsbD-like thiol-disulfide interchange protein